MQHAKVFRLIVGLLSALATGACGSAPSKKPMTIAELIPQIDRQNGQMVSVVGYLSRCEVYSCRLYRNKTESEDVDRSMSAVRAALASGATDVSGFAFPDHPVLGIGTGSWFGFFDLRATFYANSYVVITGRVTNNCRFEGRSACFDREPDLEPSAIRAVIARS